MAREELKSSRDDMEDKYLTIEPNTKVRLEILDTQIQAPHDGGLSNTLRVRHDGKEKLLNLHTTFESILREHVGSGKIKNGTVLTVNNRGKLKGKKYYDYQVFLE